MVRLDLGLIATGIGIIVALWKFANSISNFAHAVEDLKAEVKRAQDDRTELRKQVSAHEIKLTRFETQYHEIKEDLKEIKNKL
ncbi:hypothetical protein NHG29_04265 [Aerococcaceae bacterium NML160702]|nr:hypothetical protein [Aerococcaceae bacterium NML160702]